MFYIITQRRNSDAGEIVYVLNSHGWQLDGAQLFTGEEMENRAIELAEQWQTFTVSGIRVCFNREYLRGKIVNV